MARVLFLTELLPYPLVAGAKIRAYYTLRHLAARHVSEDQRADQGECDHGDPAFKDMPKVQ